MASLLLSWMITSPTYILYQRSIKSSYDGMLKCFSLFFLWTGTADHCDWHSISVVTLKNEIQASVIAILLLRIEKAFRAIRRLSRTHRRNSRQRHVNLRITMHRQKRQITCCKRAFASNLRLTIFRVSVSIMMVAFSFSAITAFTARRPRNSCDHEVKWCIHNYASNSRASLFHVMNCYQALRTSNAWRICRSLKCVGSRLTAL